MQWIEKQAPTAQTKRCSLIQQHFTGGTKPSLWSSPRWPSSAWECGASAALASAGHGNAVGPRPARGRSSPAEFPQQNLNYQHAQKARSMLNSPWLKGHLTLVNNGPSKTKAARLHHSFSSHAEADPISSALFDIYPSGYRASVTASAFLQPTLLHCTPACGALCAWSSRKSVS